MNCPWDKFEPGSISFCEERLCAWIAEPANTVSNLGYFVVAVLLFRLARRDKRVDLMYLPLVAFLVGIGSTLFHATGTFWGEFLDVSAMFLFSAFLIARNLRRLIWSYDIPWVPWMIERIELREKLIYSSVVIGSSITLLLNHPLGINLFVGHIVLAVVLEVILGIRYPETDRKPLFALGMVFAASYLLWWVDQLGLVCDPTMHYFSWHAVWHLLNSFAFYYAYVFYRGIK